MFHEILYESLYYDYLSRVFVKMEARDYRYLLKSPIDASYYDKYRDRSTKLFTWWLNRPNWWYHHLWIGIHIGLLLIKLLLLKYKKPRMSQEFSLFYSMKFDTQSKSLSSVAGLVKHGCCTRVINLCYFFSRTHLQLTCM